MELQRDRLEFLWEMLMPIRGRTLPEPFFSVPCAVLASIPLFEGQMIYSGRLRLDTSF